MKIRVVHKDGAVTELDNIERVYFLKGEGKCELCDKACSPGVCAECKEEKTGRSIFLDFEVYRCSECKSWFAYKAEKCSNCGARMIESQESEDKE